MEKIKVAIVEDQLLILNSLKIILGTMEDLAVVGTAMNGEEALRMLETAQPDVVLMDVNMPVMDGVAATKIAKQKWPSMKIVMLTTLQTRDTVLDALDAGAEGYILKAIDPLDLAAAIRLINRGETMISQEAAKLLFSRQSREDAGSEAGARAGAGADPADGELDALTDREKDVLKCLAQGLTNANIAAKLFLSEGTVRNYISSIYSKLQVHSRIEAVNRAKHLF